METGAGGRPPVSNGKTSAGQPSRAGGPRPSPEGMAPSGWLGRFLTSLGEEQTALHSHENLQKTLKRDTSPE